MCGIKIRKHRLRAGTESLFIFNQLPQDITPRLGFGLALELGIQGIIDNIEFIGQLHQPSLALFHGAAMGLHVQRIACHLFFKNGKTALQLGSLFFQLNFLSGKFFQPHRVALLLQFQRRQFITRVSKTVLQLA